MGRSSVILEAKELTIAYGDQTVIDGISFDVKEREIFVMMGPSGCGKTTVLRALAGLLRPTSGRMEFHGRALEKEVDFEAFRRRMGMVFQHGALLNSMTLEENVALPLREHEHLPEWMIRQVVRMKLAQVGLLAARERRPMELSGGMRKRASIARALVLEPEVLFFDEPSGGLDPITADGIDNLILTLRDTLDVTLVIVTHELPSIFKVADRVMMIRMGRIAALGSREKIRESEDPGVRQFISRRADEEKGAAEEFLEELSGAEE